MAAPAEWFGDTDPQTLELYVELHRKLTQGERLTRVFKLCDFQRSLQVANVRAMYPEATDHEVRCRLAARLYGRELAIKAYGWDPEVHP